jgi:hypothetical protein
LGSVAQLLSSMSVAVSSLRGAPSGLSKLTYLFCEC